MQESIAAIERQLVDSHAELNNQFSQQRYEILKNGLVRKASQEAEKMRQATEKERQIASSRFHGLFTQWPKPSVSSLTTNSRKVMNMNAESTTETTQPATTASAESDGAPAARRMRRTYASISPVTSTADTTISATSTYQK